MKTKKARIFSEDKKIKIIGFRNNNNFEVENRTLWSEILIREIYCDKCKFKEEITFHTRDIPKLIKALNILLELQKEQVKEWEREK
jgi:hypothetical protein